MANQILLKRGNEAQRSGITPANGEPIWVTDTKQLYIGDGSTAGGIAVGAGSMSNFKISGDAGDANDTIADGETVNIDGGNGITTTLTAASNVISIAVTGNIPDTVELIAGATDNTKKIRLEADTHITTGNTRVITMADQDIDLTPGTGTYSSSSHNHSGVYAEQAFKTISVSGQSDVVADAVADTLTLIAGSGITITTNATNDEITINGTGTYTWTVAGDSGSEAVASGETITFTGGTALSSTYTPATNTMEFVIDIGTGSTQVAAGDHNHDSTYLALSGGSLTGDLTLNDNVNLNLGTGNDVQHTFNATQYNIDLNSVDMYVRDNANATIMKITESTKQVDFGGSVVVAGDLTVNGTTTSINTTELLVEDNLITLNSTYTGSTPSANAGFEVERGTLTNATLQWNETGDYWEVDKANGTFYEIATTNTLGSYLLIADIDDVPVNGVTNAPISSNWAYDHENAADPHTVYPLLAGTETITGVWDFTNATFDGGTY